MAEPAKPTTATSPPPPAPPAPPRPTSLDVDYQEIGPGHYNAIISVGFDHGVTSVGLLIIAGTQTPVERLTGLNGRLIYEVPAFTEPEMDFEVQVDGHPKLQKRDTLDGPPRVKPKKIGFFAGLVEGGLVKNFLAVQKEGDEENKKD